MRITFGDYVVDSERFELTHAGELVPVEPQAFEVLAYLVAHRERVVPRDELLEQVWGTSYVSDSALATRIKEARRATGDDGRAQSVIRTVHGRGYRFVAPCSELAPEPTAEPRQRDRAVEDPASRPPTLEQRIRFCRTQDGVNLAYAVSGSGPPLVKVANWLTHLEFDATSPVWRHLLEDLSEDFQLIRYDARGSGLSDWDVPEWSLDAWTEDLATVVDELSLERFPLLCISQGGAAGIRYALEHPGRVSHLVLLGCYARGAEQRDAAQRETRRAITDLTAHGWGEDGSVHAQMFSASMIPKGTPEQVRWLTELQRVSASKENAVRFRRTTAAIDILDLLERVDVPTLVLHSRRDQQVPFEEGRLLAAQIPEAHLVPLDSDNHLLLEDEPAWQVFREEVRSFLGS